MNRERIVIDTIVFLSLLVFNSLAIKKVFEHGLSNYDVLLYDQLEQEIQDKLLNKFGVSQVVIDKLNQIIKLCKPIEIEKKPY